VRSHEIARRYAEALYGLAQEQASVDEIESAYQQVLTDIAGVPAVSRFLAHPLVSRERKNEMIGKAFPALPGHLRNLIRLLIRNGREDYLDLIYEEFLILRAEEEGVIRVQVATAQEFSPEDRDRLTDRLAQALGRRVTLEERLDPNLLGGVRLEVDGTVIDGTLRAKLEGLLAVLEG
jgi:F-type H+-transporting ATPase subunit delta